MPLFSLVGALCSLLLMSTSSAPVQNDPPRTLPAAPVEEAIQVDGHLTETSWQRAPTASGFRQLSPNEGAPATERTEVHVLYGEDHLYVGARLYDAHPSRVRMPLSRRDADTQADYFTASFDSYFDRKTAYTFGVSAAGVQFDGLQRGWLDRSWDAIWASEVRHTDFGWTVEMRIPYSQLRFAEEGRQTWGVQFRRVIPRKGETVEWPLVPRRERESGLVAEYGRLTDVRATPRRNVQVTPYSVSRVETGEHEAGGLQADGNVEAGGDVQVGLGSGFTLNATLNPDFGQVEADPAQLNLSAFETFYPERRPFFIEGLQVFDYAQRGGDLLYTRRIGGTEPLIGAVKVSGRSTGGLSAGALTAVTGDGFSPERYYGAARAEQEIGTYSSAGGALTLLDAPGTANATERHRALAGGGDWDLRFLENAYGLSGHASITHRRPAGDPAETGLSFSAQGARLQGDWTYSGTVIVLDDDFDLNDVGRLRQNNYVRLRGGVERQLNGGDPFGPFQRGRAGLNVGQSWSYREGLSRGLGFFGRASFETKGFQELDFFAHSDYLLGGYDLYETRGLGPYAAPRRAGLNVSFETDSRRSWTVEPGVGATFYEYGGLSMNAELGGAWSAGARLRFSGSLSYNRADDRTAWVANEAFAKRTDGWYLGRPNTPPARLDPDDYRPLGSPTAFDDLFAGIDPYEGQAGRFYVPLFGARDTRSFDATVRASAVFAPRLSLQVFGQFFAARGQYDRFRMLRAPDRLAPLEGFPRRYDFATSSVLGNTVLRWEFQRGSAFYVVWSHTRRQRDDTPYYQGERPSPYRDDITGLFDEAFSVFPTNVFLVKLKYTFLG